MNVQEITPPSELPSAVGGRPPIESESPANALPFRGIVPPATGGEERRTGGISLRLLMAGIAAGPALVAFGAFFLLASIACRHLSGTLESEFLRGTAKGIRAT